MVDCGSQLSGRRSAGQADTFTLEDAVAGMGFNFDSLLFQKTAP